MTLQRFTVELTAPAAWNTRDLKAKLNQCFQTTAFDVKQVERCSIQAIVDEAHAIRDQIDGAA